MKLALVSNFWDLPHEHYVLNLLFCEGLEYFHLRKKNYTRAQMESYLARIPAIFHPRIILHSHFELIDQYGLQGGHFTKKLPPEEYEWPAGTAPLNGLLPQGWQRTGYSVHSLSELREVKARYDYLFLSPVFDSISNRGYNSKFRLHDLRLFLSNKTNRPEIIALGGITEDKVERIAELGFDGLALLGHIWTAYEQEPDIVKAVQRFCGIQRLIRQFAPAGSEG
jgi:thiamine-phosphate pyrophosphorylase